MRVHIRAFCETAVAIFEASDPVVEFGSLLVEDQQALANLRPLFRGGVYIGCDARPGPGVDRVEDIAATSFASGSAGTLVCLDTLEHVFAVGEAFREMHRLLRPGGLLVVATVMRFPIHNYPDDYWRFTPQCLDRLSSSFPFRIVGSQGVESFPHTVFALAVKEPAPPDATYRARRFIDAYQERLDRAKASLPLGARVGRFARARYRSKGERRELADEFTARFTIVQAAGRK